MHERVAAMTLNVETPPGSPQGDLGGFLVPFGVQVDPELLSLALTHRSWAFENDAPHNERLEFLGDTILGQAVTVKLYLDHPDLSEDDLAKRRAALVSTVALAEVARGLDLGSYIRLGKGEAASGGSDKDKILADATEAVIGAVFLSVGPAEANRFVLELLEPLFSDPERFTVVLDPKTTLQKIASERGLPNPSYGTTGSGPDHNRLYSSRVELDGVSGEGSGRSKKVAELAAARDAVMKIQAGRKKRARAS